MLGLMNLNIAFLEPELDVPEELYLFISKYKKLEMTNQLMC